MLLSRRLLLLAAIAGAILPISCSKKEGGGEGGGDKPKIRVAVVTNNPEAFWLVAEKGAKAAEKDFGCEVIFRMPEKGDVSIQRDIVNELSRKGISGISVSVINPTEQTQDLKLISEKINLITMDNDADKSGRRCYVGTDNYLAGKAAGRLVKEAMPQGGTVAIFVGTMASLNAQQRFQGCVDELAGSKDAKGPVFGKYTLYKNEAITDGPNASVATANANDALAKLSGVKDLCMVGLYAYNAPAILEAAKSKGVVDKIKIVSFDEYESTLTAIDKGEIYGTIVQDPYNFGYKSVEILVALANKDDSKLAKAPVPHKIVVKADGVDAATGEKRYAAKAFAEELKKLTGK
jgi:ribose transport system substrate-binding protein